MSQRTGFSTTYSYQKKLAARKAMMRRRRIFFLTLIALTAVGVFLFVMLSTVKPGSNTFYEGIVVDGVALGGMTEADAHAAIAAQQQRKLDALSFTVVFEEQKWTLTSHELGVAFDTQEQLHNAYQVGREGSWFERRKTIKALEDEPYIAYTKMSYDSAQLTRALAEIKAMVDLPASDATVEFRPDKDEKFLFTKESDGRLANLDDMVAQATAFLDGAVSGTVTVKTTLVEPSIRVADIEPNTVLIAKVSTSLKDSSENRLFNVEKALDSFNGMEILPGENFSFNEVVGPSTEEAGFKLSKVILRGEYVDGPGGGVCQASTTLYHAVVQADLEIVERHHHTIPSSYVPVGQDATVTDSGYDFVFRNNTDDSIYIRAAIVGSSCEVSIYGRPLPEGMTIEMVTETVSTTPAPEPLIQVDSEGLNVKGDQKYVDSPKSRPGYQTKTYRVYYQDKQEVNRERLSSDTYKASQGTRWVPVGSPLLAPPPSDTFDNSVVGG